MTFAAQRLPGFSAVRLGLARVLAQVALAGLVLLMIGVVAGTVFENPATKADWIFDVVPRVLLATILTVAVAFIVGLPLRVNPRGRAWLRAHGWLIWMTGVAGIAFTVGALMLVGIDPLLFAAGQPGYPLTMTLFAIAWCVIAFSAVHLPIWFADTERGKRRASMLAREVGVLVVQAIVAFGVMCCVSAIALVISEPFVYAGFGSLFLLLADSTFAPVFFISTGFVLGLPIRLVGPIRRFWANYGEIGLVGILASLAGVVYGALSAASPALELWLLALAFFLVNARLPITRWRRSLVRRRPSAR